MRNRAVQHQHGQEAEATVSRFYNQGGWDTDAAGITQDAQLFEDLRTCARTYVSRCRLRVLRHLPPSGKRLLDMASGPIQYPEYLAYSKYFDERHCVDLSESALEQARRKIGNHGVYHCGSFFDLPFEEASYDAAVSLHTIYHMDQNRQEEAVRKLLHLVRPGAPVVVVYSNPRALPQLLGLPIRLIRKAFRAFRRPPHPPPLYFYQHPLAWWDRFRDEAEVRLYPWRSFAAAHQKLLFPDNRLGTWMLDLLFRLEDRWPRLFVRLFQYPLIVLVRKPSPDPL